MKIFALLLSLCAVTSCVPLKNDVNTVGTEAKRIAVDCAKQAVADAIPNLLPEVNQILIDSSRTQAAKEVALDQLKLSGTEALACAVREAFEDLSKLVRGSATMDTQPAKDAAASYMSARFTYVDGFTPPSK